MPVVPATQEAEVGELLEPKIGDCRELWLCHCPPAWVTKQDPIWPEKAHSLTPKREASVCECKTMNSIISQYVKKRIIQDSAEEKKKKTEFL